MWQEARYAFFVFVVFCVYEFFAISSVPLVTLVHIVKELRLDKVVTDGLTIKTVKVNEVCLAICAKDLG